MLLKTQSKQSQTTQTLKDSTTPENLINKL